MSLNFPQTALSSLLRSPTAACCPPPGCDGEGEPKPPPPPSSPPSSPAATPKGLWSFFFRCGVGKGAVGGWSADRGSPFNHHACSCCPATTSSPIHQRKTHPHDAVHGLGRHEAIELHVQPLVGPRDVRVGEGGARLPEAPVPRLGWAGPPERHHGGGGATACRVLRFVYMGRRMNELGLVSY
jgi:hypothetical protein